MFVVRSVAHLRLTRQIRNVSGSVMLCDAKPTNPTPVETPATPTSATDYSNVINRRLYKVTDFDRKILVWMKRYPNKEAIPDEISAETIQYVRNKARIRVANWMIAGTILGCFLAVWSGKSAHKSGDSLTKRNLEWHKKINDEHQANLAKLEAKQE